MFQQTISITDVCFYFDPGMQINLTFIVSNDHFFVE